MAEQNKDTKIKSRPVGVKDKDIEVLATDINNIVKEMGKDGIVKKAEMKTNNGVKVTHTSLDLNEGMTIPAYDNDRQEER